MNYSVLLFLALYITYAAAARSRSSCKDVTGGQFIPPAGECFQDNRDNNDGCSSDCFVEPGWSCVDTSVTDGISDTTTTSICSILAICGDGTQSETEQCDDGNLNSDDGCSAACTLEAGFDCSLLASQISICRRQVCGNSIRDSNEACDNGGNAGCTLCVVEQFYDCVGIVGTTSLCQKTPVCGDSVLDAGEGCDNPLEANCLSCQPADGYTCSGQPSVCYKCGNGLVELGEDCEPPGTAVCDSLCRAIVPECGNAIVEVGENCDNGPQGGDGCSSACVVERGYSCTRVQGESSVCTPLYACGNNKLEPYNSEQCDTVSEGCVGCRIVFGWACTSRLGQESVCTKLPPVVCGDGKVEAGELCDDGNTAAGDGCSPSCAVEEGWRCSLTAAGSACQLLPPHCENGQFEPSLGEQCDNFFSPFEDGCSNNCTITQGWTCPFNVPLSQSGCVKDISDFCGNGYINEGEQCDDGFYPSDGDGCSRTCQIEFGWICHSRDYRGISSCQQIAQ